MSLAFSRKADLTGIADSPDPRERLLLSEVFHKAFVKVDEKGTEAAAATTAVGVRAIAVAREEAFVADRPFLFFLRDRRSGLVLFMGRVDNPSSGDDASDSASDGASDDDPKLNLAPEREER